MASYSSLTQFHLFIHHFPLANLKVAFFSLGLFSISMLLLLRVSE